MSSFVDKNGGREEVYLFNFSDFVDFHWYFAIIATVVNEFEFGSELLTSLIKGQSLKLADVEAFDLYPDLEFLLGWEII